ncbi:MAG: ABC transporter ATP-binding protein [Chthoniobacterales bacterium]
MNSFFLADHLSVSYGEIKAVRGISFEVPMGNIVTLIGSNGAGKSSILRAIAGATSYEGKLFFQGALLNQEEPEKRASHRINLVPEGRSIFGNLTVSENLMLGAWRTHDSAKRQKNLDRVFHFFPKLQERLSQIAGTLSGGEQQMLALGRALMTEPQLLLLDEPSMGLAPLLIREIFSIIKKINAEGMTILLVEQNATMALKIAHHAYLIELGVITLAGTGEELLVNPKVRTGYLGG